jgi:serine/threonine protein kinase
MSTSHAPSTVSHYRTGKLIGAGAMGAVYLATDRRDQSLVALKLLHEHLSQDAAFRARFEQEAHIAAILRSPYTVHVLDSGLARGRLFIAMEYVQGRTLKDVLSEGPLPPERALRIATQAARALEEAGARGVVHRDVKPDNILVRRDDSVKVADFGIARQEATAAFTAPGALVGTLPYAAPEQLMGQADHRSDVYALGATLYHMLAGQPPFAGDLCELSRRIRESPPPGEPLARAPDELAAIVRRCLEKDPADRYESASELVAALVVAEQAVAGRDLSLVAGDDATAYRDAGSQGAVSLQLAMRKQRLPFARRFSSTTYDLTVRNESDEVATVHLSAEDEGGTCRFDLPETVSVLPYSVASAAVTVAPRKRRWRGGSESHVFTVYGSMGGGRPPAAVSGQYEERPYAWRPVAAAATALGIAAVVTGLWWGGVIGGGNGEEQEIIEALKAGGAAFNAGDTDAFFSHVTESFVLDFSGYSKRAHIFGGGIVAPGEPVEGYGFDNIRVDGDQATLDGWMGGPGARERWRLSFIKQDGVWLADGMEVLSVAPPSESGVTEVRVETADSQMTPLPDEISTTALYLQVSNKDEAASASLMVLRLPPDVTLKEALAAADPSDVGAETVGFFTRIAAGHEGTWILENLSPGRYGYVNDTEAWDPYAVKYRDLDVLIQNGTAGEFTRTLGRED